MKKIVSLLLVLVLILSFSGCTKTRKLYNQNLSKYVTVGDYVVTVDTTSKEYLEYFEEFDDSFAQILRLEITEGTVADGDTVNIDYKGYLNGKAFDGGTGVSYDLTIGSNTFIEGFEEALIGCTIGETVDIKVTFPKDYGVDELNGQETTFTVTINAVIKTDNVNTGNVKKIGYATFEEYSKAKKEYAITNTAWDIIFDNSSVIEYPEREMEIIFNETINFLEEACKLNGMTLDEFISYNNMKRDSFNQYLKENDIVYSMHKDLICYYILDAEDYVITEQDLNNALKDLEKENDMKNGEIKYPNGMIEQRAAYLAAQNIILKKAVIK